MNRKSEFIKPGLLNPTIRSCAESTAQALGLVAKPIKRKQRALETKPRNRDEDVIRTNIIKDLRKNGFSVWRIEPTVRGRFGCGDLWVMHHKGVAFWLEVKAPSGVLSKDQIYFNELCNKARIYYFVVRSVQEAIDIARLL